MKLNAAITQSANFIGPDALSVGLTAQALHLRHPEWLTLSQIPNAKKKNALVIGTLLSLVQKSA